jgi:adenosylhomocysteine nucleosidase
MKIVVLISADAEWQVVRNLYPSGQIQATPLGEQFELSLDTRPLTLFHGGWGKISAAASAQYVIDHLQPDLLINLGTCGGFEGRIERGTIMLVEKTYVYDILEQMTDAEAATQAYSTRLDLAWLPRVLPYPVLRGWMVSADRDIVRDDIPLLIRKYEAIAADWESAAIAWVASKNNARLLILRGVSDLVGDEGGEVYGDFDLFLQRTRDIMRKLFDQLPAWLSAIEKVQQGYRGY